MAHVRRRSFVLGSGLPILRAGAFAQAARAQNVSFSSDGIPHSSVEFADLLAELARKREITVDEYSRGGIVAELEQRMAVLLGKETAVFMPSGTLANHLAVRLLAKGRKVIVQGESHLYNDAGDCVQHLSGLNLVPLGSGKASFTLEDVQQSFKAAESGRVTAPIGAISIESPVRRKFGETFPFPEVKRIAAFAREHEIGMHLDGARLFLAAAYTRVSAAEYSSQFDTVYVSLYKYFNSGFGAILAGPHKLLDDLYHTRRMFGGGLAEVWPTAAMALHYLDGFEARYARAVQASEALLSQLRSHPGVVVTRIERGSNIAGLSVAVPDPEEYAKRLRSKGITVGGVRRSEKAGSTDVLLVMNETIMRRPAEEIASQFIEAIRAG